LATGSDRQQLQAGKQEGSTAPATTEEPAELLSQTPQENEVDAETLRRAQEIAARLALPRPRRDPSAHRGLGEIHSLRYRGAADEIDLDATVASLLGSPLPQQEDIVVRERLHTRRSVVLAVDISGSMRGERVRTAAAVVGALASELARERLGVLAFWSDAALLVPLGRPVVPRQLLETLVRIPARGLTNITFPLQLAREQLSGAPPRQSRVLLLSDCVHNAGPDPRTVAAALPRLDVLLDTSGEHDMELGRELAQLGRGRLATTRHHREVAGALSRLFAP